MKNQNTILIAILSALVCFAFLPETQAVEPATADTALPGGNTADGQNALLSLTTGTFNTAIGFDSLLSTSDANFNTGVGAGTLLLNTGSRNTAVGAGALFSNTTGVDNTAVGGFALFTSTGGANTAVGEGALQSNTSANFNTAVGRDALFSTTDGGSNVALGHQAGISATGSGNVYIGQGVAGVAGEDNHTYIRNIKDTDLSADVNGRLVVVDINTGLLGFVTLSLNEVLKEHTKIEEQQASIAELKSIIAQQQKGMEVLTAKLKEQAAQIQKVSAQLEVNKPALRVVENKP